MGWYEDAKQSSPILIGTIFVLSFTSGWGTSEALMKISGQEKVTGGTYTLNKDISTYYVLKGDYEKILKERDFLSHALDDTQKKLVQLKGEIAQTDLMKQPRVQLEQLKRNAEAELAKQRVKLAVASQVASITRENTNSNNDYYNSIQRDIQALEEQIKSINDKLLEQF